MSFDRDYALMVLLDWAVLALKSVVESEIDSDQRLIAAQIALNYSERLFNLRNRLSGFPLQQDATNLDLLPFEADIKKWLSEMEVEVLGDFPVTQLPRSATEHATVLQTRSCSWCHHHNPVGTTWCEHCKHNAQEARAKCRCKKCTRRRR